MSYMTQNLLKRGHTWSVRYKVPREWQSKIGKESIVRSLKTRDLDEARRLRHAALAKIIAEVEQVIYPHRGTSKEALEEALVMSEELSTVDDPDLIEGAIQDVIIAKEAELGIETTKQMWAIAINNQMPISLAGAKWLESQTEKVTKGTLDGRRKVVSQFVDDMGDLHISKISPRVTSAWLSDHLEPSGRSPKTLGRYIGAMELLWKWSYRREWCTGLSPFDGLTSELKKTKSKKRAYTDDEMRLFVDGLKKKHNSDPAEYDVGVLLLESSARLNEIAELRAKHVKDDGEVHVIDGKNKSANRCLFFCSDRAKSILTRRIANKRPEDQVFEELTPGGQDNKLGHSLSKRMRTTLAGVIPNAMGEGLDIHGIRRWGATVWENLEGVDRTLMKRCFGHSVGDLLGDVYSDGAEKERMKRAFKAFSESVQKRVP